MGISPKKKSTLPLLSFQSRPPTVLASLTFLAGVLTYICLSNVWKFHSHVRGEHFQRQRLTVAMEAVADLPMPQQQQQQETATVTATFHPSHEYLRQTPKDLPGLFSSSTASSSSTSSSSSAYPTQVTWPFSDSPTAVRILFVHVGKAGGMSLYRKIQVVDAY